jgi:hypothetical protein
MNIGDKVKYKDVYDEPSVGVIVDVSSSMVSYNDMKLEDGIPYYVSKKMSAHEIEPVYVSVKPKNMDTVFLIIETNRGKTEFLPLDEVIVYE